MITLTVKDQSQIAKKKWLPVVLVELDLAPRAVLKVWHKSLADQTVLSHGKHFLERSRSGF